MSPDFLLHEMEQKALTVWQRDSGTNSDVTESRQSLAVISPSLATTEEMKAFIPWEVSPSFSGQQNIWQNCDKVVLLQLQQIIQLGSGRQVGQQRENQERRNEEILRREACRWAGIQET